MAVSGGVDSMVLLHLAKDLPGVDLIVAHVDHNLREDSVQDKNLVKKVASEYGLDFIATILDLQTKSEDEARKQRYAFLNKVKRAYDCQAVITAHHKDDVIETAIINIIRGTGRRGLTALKSGEILRPLLDVDKSDVYDYARAHNLKWREDSTNVDTAYLRNYVRHEIIPAMERKDSFLKQKFAKIIDTEQEASKEINQALQTIMGGVYSNNEVDRHSFIMLPHQVSLEVMREVFEQHKDGINITSQLLEKATHFIKTAKQDKSFELSKTVKLHTNKHFYEF